LNTKEKNKNDKDIIHIKDSSSLVVKEIKVSGTNLDKSRSHKVRRRASFWI